MLDDLKDLHVEQVFSRGGLKDRFAMQDAVDMLMKSGDVQRMELVAAQAKR